MFDSLPRDSSDRRDDILERIQDSIVVVGDCWLWTGSTSGEEGRGAGYPRMSLNSRTVAVHRVVATHFYGYLPNHIQVDHRCKNRLCLNPKHLEPVTQKMNCRRRDGK